MQYEWSKIRSLLSLVSALAFASLLQGCQGGNAINGIGAKADAMQTLSIGEFYSVFGTKYLMSSSYIFADSERSYDSYSSYGSKSPKIFNYVFLNPDDLTSQWLLPHSNFFFFEARELPLWKAEKEESKNAPQPQELTKTSKPPRPPTQLLLYTLVKANTNDNKILDYADRKTIAISDVSGSDYTEIIQDVDSIIHQQMYSADEFLMVYWSHGKYTAMRLHLKTRQITLTKDLAPIPKSQPPLS